MPARVVDGEGVWRSKKLKNVPVEFRAEYANLLSLAQANGAFECEADQVWADVYAFNRPDVSAERVVQILDALEAAELLFRWEQSGKVYGYWIGIEKTGRLPTGSHLARYKNLPPSPPSYFWAREQSGSVPDNSGSMSTGFGIGLVLDRCGVVQEQPHTLSQAQNNGHAGGLTAARSALSQDDGQEESMAIRDQIESICENELGVTPERAGDAVWPRMQKLVAKHNGVHALTAKFRAWAEGLSQPPSAKPVAAFLRFYDGLPVEQARTLGEAPAVDIKRVVRDIAFLSGNKVHITDREKAFLARQMTEEDYTADEVLKAFGAFYKNLDTDNPQAVRFAGRDFVQTVDQSIHAARRIKQESERTAAQFEDIKARMQADAQAEHEAEMARITAEKAEQAALADEPL